MSRPDEPAAIGDHSLAAYLQTRRAAVETALDRYMPAPPDCPELLAGAMRYSLLAGGKRLRPILTLATAETIDPDGGAARAMPAACAIEMIHTYSLVHDDLPAMDDDTLRRGRPTVHVEYGEAMAILAGDGLLTEAFRVLARWPATDDPAVVDRKLRTVERVAAGAGASGMVGGQVLDIQPADASAARRQPAAAMAALRTTSWTWRATRRRSARPPARTRPPARSPIRPSWGSNSRACWRRAPLPTRSRRCGWAGWAADVSRKSPIGCSPGPPRSPWQKPRCIRPAMHPLPLGAVPQTPGGR